MKLVQLKQGSWNSRFLEIMAILLFLINENVAYCFRSWLIDIILLITVMSFESEN